MRLWRRMAVVVAVWTAMGALAETSLAEHVSVRASRGADFGRIVFLWDQPVTHEMIHQGRDLTVRFGRRIEASYQRVLGTLRKYIDRVRSSPDGRSVNFRLTGPFEAFGFDSGNAVIIEIAEMPPPAKPEKPVRGGASSADSQTKIAAQAVAAKDGPGIRVRTGQHPDYSRVVVDWPAKVGYALEQADGVVTVRFSAAAELQLGALTRNPPPFVGAVRSRVSGAETVLEMAVARSSRVRHFLSGAKLVMDVRRPAGAEEIAELPPQSAPPQQPAETDAPPSPSPSPTEAAPSPAPAAAAPSPAPAAAAPSPSPASSVSRDPSPRTVQSGSAPVELRPVAVERADAASEATAQTGVKLKFDWTEPVAAAVFRRVGFLWVVFDKWAKIGAESLLQAGGDVIQSVDQAPSSEATVLRLRVSRRINPRLSRNGLSWIVELSRKETDVSTPIEIKAQPDSPVGARIFLPVPEPGKPVGITDPAVGDNLVVVPVIPLGHGIQQAYSYSQLKVLPTLQGIVIQPRVDDLRVRPLRQGVELTSGATLALSPVSADVAAGAKLAASKPLSKILELGRWEVPSLSEFNVMKQDLQAEVAAGRGEQRILKRFNLARFYFANRFAAETLGVMAELKREQPELENQPEFRLMRGGASFLMGRLSDAAADFTHESLDQADEANFWRAAVVAESGDMLAAAPALIRAGVIIQKYPRPLKIPLGTLVAAAAAEIGDIKTAKAYLEAVKGLKPNEGQRAAIAFIEGALLNLGGDTDGAVSKWEAVQEMPNRWMRARATVARMELLLKLKQIEPKEAIEELETLRFAWRGDDFEFALLRRLGGLYLDEGIYRNGLQALRQAATHYRDNEEAPQVTQQMADVFNALYLEDGADAMPAVTAIAVYEEFKELTPAGARGDEMIRKLADRLAGVDLLDQAAEVLEGQIRFRLKGMLKSEVGARLAIVYLLARRYDQALTALDATTAPNEPDALLTQRRHLRARALMGLDRPETALAILKEDKAADADLLRAEIFWKGGDWNSASKELRKILRASGAKKNEPVTPEQAQKVLNYSIALVLSGNERALAKVRQGYGAAVQTTELRDAFRLVSAPTAPGLISPGSVPSRVKLAENFKTFLAEYKKRLQKRGLSGVTARKTAAADGDNKESETQGG